MLPPPLLCLMACTFTSAAQPAPEREARPPMSPIVTATATQTPWKPTGPWPVEVVVRNPGREAMSVPSALPSGFALAQVGGTFHHGARFESGGSAPLAPGQERRETWDLHGYVAHRKPPPGAHTLTLFVVADGGAAASAQVVVTLP